jgi:archaellum component FlaC
MTSGRMASSETQAKPKGKQYDIAYSGVPILDANGKAIGAMEFFTDLTDIREAARQAQKKIENALEFINGEMGKIQNGAAEAKCQCRRGLGRRRAGSEERNGRQRQCREVLESHHAGAEGHGRPLAHHPGRCNPRRSKRQDRPRHLRLQPRGMELARRTESGCRASPNRPRGQPDHRRLKGQMDKISRDLNLITDLANQTNLLASTQPSKQRGGRCRPRVCVVASEVKSLPLSPGIGRAHLGHDREPPRTKTNHAVEAVASSNTGCPGRQRGMRETIATFTKIADSIEKISHNVGDVASATQEQAASVEEITASVNEVNGLVQNTAKESTDAAAASEESSAAIEQISKVIGNVTVVVESVKTEINNFK